MNQPQLFIPDQALHFRRLPEQYVIIQSLREVFEQYKAYGYSSIESFYYAFVLCSPNKHEIATAVGAVEFSRRMTEYLRQAQNMVEHVIDRYLHPFAGRLDPHNSVSNCLNPIAMLFMATEILSPGSSALQRRKKFEALRQLAIALQLFAIETVDDEAWVAEDLSTIDRLSWERLFLANESEKLWAVVELHPRNIGSDAGIKSVKIFQRSKDKNRLLGRLRRSGVLYREELLTCRIAQVLGKRYFIYAANRRKRLLSTLLKLERGRSNTDRRGWKYVVVAVQEEGKKGLALATPQDAQDFASHTVNTLWVHPLYKEPDRSAPNPDSSPRYQDLKTVGRFHRADNGRIIAGSAEQLTVTISRHVETLFAHDQVNHFLYRSRQILRYLAPLWFPHRREPFKCVSCFSLPGYGVMWDKQRCREQLDDWWQSQL